MAWAAEAVKWWLRRFSINKCVFIFFSPLSIFYFELSHQYLLENLILQRIEVISDVSGLQIVAKTWKILSMNIP